MQRWRLLWWFLVPAAGFPRCAVLWPQVYVKAILPIGVLFSVNLWLGNTAVMYISVAFSQMLKVRCAGPAAQNSVDMQPYRLPHPPCLPASTPHSSCPCATPPYQPCNKTQGTDSVTPDPRHETLTFAGRDAGFGVPRRHGAVD